MSLEVTGKIKKFLEAQTGETKSGGTWSKQQFIVETETEYNNLYCFEVFGDEKVSNLTKYQKVGDNVTVEFNVSTNEYRDKYYTSLSAWKISKAQTNNQPETSTYSAPSNTNGFPPAPDFSNTDADNPLPF